MKLQKLLYYANGWWLATTGKPFLAENPQVWRYGPVFRGLYGTFARFGHNAIGGPVPAGPFTPTPPTLDGDANQANAQALLNWIWQEHGHKSAVELSNETHAVGTPWRKIAERFKFSVPQNTEISPQEDWAYFAELARQRGIQVVALH